MHRVFNYVLYICMIACSKCFVGNKLCISLTASRVQNIKQSSGVIAIKSKTENLQHVIPFQATVLHG